MKSPTEFAAEVLGIDLSERQREDLEAMLNYPLLVLACVVGAPVNPSWRLFGVYMTHAYGI